MSEPIFLMLCCFQNKSASFAAGFGSSQINAVINLYNSYSVKIGYHGNQSYFIPRKRTRTNKSQIFFMIEGNNAEKIQ
jgi:hypothetical protein